MNLLDNNYVFISINVGKNFRNKINTIEGTGFIVAQMQI